MFFPGVRRRTFHVPHAILPFALAVVAVTLTISAWAVFSPRQAGLEAIARPLPDISSIGSVAYTVPGKDFDELVVRRASDDSTPDVVATFPNSGSTGYHAHGSASPLGGSVAVISLPSFATRGSAGLSLVEVATGEVVSVPGTFDYFTAIAWAPDESKLAAVKYSDGPGGRVQTVVEIDAASAGSKPVAQFTDALDVVPVGYSFDSARLFVVVVDQKGSNLYVVGREKAQLIAELSPGRTRDWSLSPDGARLAFIDILAGGSRTLVGRTLVIATGSVTTLPADANQLGSTWMPGSAVPAFGGPGGTWQLSSPDAGGAYIVPEQWAPNSAYLVANVFAAGSDKDGKPATALELVEPERPGAESTRTVLSDIPGAVFLGWVHNIN